MKKLLIANRGEIAKRIARTCRNMGIESLLVCSEDDRDLSSLVGADRILYLNSSGAKAYLAEDEIIKAALDSKADAIHPGYGFLSEKASFAAKVKNAGLVFVGASEDTLRLAGDKQLARHIAKDNGLSVVPGYDGDEQDKKTLSAEAKKVGFPLMIKASSGGGGRGMRLVHTLEECEAALESTAREAETFFGTAKLILEKAIENPRHIEVQVFGDKHKNLVHFFERDCSVQRKQQKIIEECPAQFLDNALRDELYSAALLIARKINLENAGTVEFLVSENSSQTNQQFYFLEINPRLQVEHPVTEMVCGVDLVELQIRVARGEKLKLTQKEIQRNGAAIEARIYAENPAREFSPSTGSIEYLELPGEEQTLRLEQALKPGLRVSANYDSMLGKVIAWGEDSQEARERLRRALGESAILGLDTNIDFLKRLLEHPDFGNKELSTVFVREKLHELTSVNTDTKCYLQALYAGLIAELVVHENSTLNPTSHSRRDPFSSSNFAFSRPFQVGRAGRTFLSGPLRLFSIKRLGESSTRALSARLVDWRRSLNAPNNPIFSVEVEEETFTLELKQRTYNRDKGTLSLGTSEGDLFIEFFAKSNYYQTEKQYIRLHKNTFEISEQHLASTEDAVEQSSESGIRDVLSPLPGSIQSLCIGPGDTVSKGERLLTIESMKMEHPVSAPCAGVVHKIETSAGNIVERDELLLSILELEAVS